MAVLPVAVAFIVAGFRIITVISISATVITGVRGEAGTIKKPP
jgi:ABC-type proline/glycine betaine transport system permease subunit